jgi:hypothetical protein
LRIGAVLAAISVAATFSFGCGSDEKSSDGGEPTAAAAKAEVDGEQVTFGSLVAQIRGHHRAALERHHAGDRAASLKHANHPAKEILDSIQPELEQPSPETVESLTRALRAVPAAIRNGSNAEVTDAVTAAAAQTREAETAVVGETAGTDAYRGSVIAHITAVAAHEYEEALDGDKIALEDEFQDGYGFIQEAQDLYRTIEPRVKDAAEHEAAEISEALEKLDAAMPSGEAPANPAPLEDVEGAAKLVGAELEETVGARPVEQSDPAAVQAEIERLLDEIAETYDPAQPDAAAELVAEAYLQNYETIEAGVIEAAPDVNAALEPLLGAELRKRIREGASKAEIAAMVRRAKQLLAQAVEAVESGK